MICKQCGAEYPDGGRFCPSCGTPSAPPEAQRSDTYPLEPRSYRPSEQTYQSKEQTYQASEQTHQPTAQNVYFTQQPARTDPDTFFGQHPEYRPLSPWAFFGLSLLYAVPIVGFVFLIVHSCSRGNLIRRSYARSFWCGLIIVAIIALVVLIVALISGIGIAGLVSAYS